MKNPFYLATVYWPCPFIRTGRFVTPINHDFHMCYRELDNQYGFYATQYFFYLTICICWRRNNIWIWVKKKSFVCIAHQNGHLMVSYFWSNHFLLLKYTLLSISLGLQVSNINNSFLNLPIWEIHLYLNSNDLNIDVLI